MLHKDMLSHNPKFLRIEHIFYLLLFIAATLSLGYYHADEHYQIIEFAQMKLGNVKATDLPWEYEAAIRPTLQPFICYHSFRLLSYLGITDPYQLSLFLRLLTALFAAAVIPRFIKHTQHLISPSLVLSYKYLSYFLWFIPVLSVRFSSETWAGLSFVMALTFLIQKPDSMRSFIIGCIFLSLSFHFRYQSAFLILGFLAWSIIIKRIKWNRIVTMLLVFLAVTGWALLIDHWFYGHYQLTFWNYFSVNIVHNVASKFGVSPWYKMGEYIIFAPTWPIGSLIIMSIVVLILKNNRSLFLWSIIPFIGIHTIVPHKELRFLFPIIWLIPIILILGYENLLRANIRLFYSVKRIKVFRIIAALMLCTIVLINILALATSLNKRFDRGSKFITKYIYDKYRNQQIKLLYTTGNNPYSPWSFLKESFYSNKDVLTKEIFSPLEIHENICSKDTILVICVAKNQLSQYYHHNNLSTNELAIEAKGSPDWVQEFLRYYHDAPDKTLTLLKIVPSEVTAR
jgi:phosphatidylinositol glycan class B